MPTFIAGDITTTAPFADETELGQIHNLGVVDFNNANFDIGNTSLSQTIRFHNKIFDIPKIDFDTSSITQVHSLSASDLDVPKTDFGDFIFHYIREIIPYDITLSKHEVGSFHLFSKQFLQIAGIVVPPNNIHIDDAQLNQIHKLSNPDLDIPDMNTSVGIKQVHRLGINGLTISKLHVPDVDLKVKFPLSVEDFDLLPTIFDDAQLGQIHNLLNPDMDLKSIEPV